jgi:hypothetical protein
MQEINMLLRNLLNAYSPKNNFTKLDSDNIVATQRSTLSEPDAGPNVTTPRETGI